MIAACGIEGDLSFADFYQASSVHLKGGANIEPKLTELGLQLSASGELVADANQRPGQNPAAVTVSGSSAIPASVIQNSNTPFSVTTTAPETTIEARRAARTRTGRRRRST